jgi:two-component system nitrogen regulation response regulator GlnG/two-component system response regulator HydG
MVGESAAAWKLRRSVEVIARRTGHVLVLGASGTGKELVAAAVHARSARSERSLVARNAATIPEGILDAELFGNAKNFPNPGMAERPGLIGQAHGSTLFLDEFAELPRALQAHLLRVLDEGEYHRLGDALPRRSDFRLIAATNRPESSLKHDVLARLPFRIDMPDLNARRDDIPLLVRHQMRCLAQKDAEIARAFFGGKHPEEPLFPCALIRALLSHTYTTNVRELNNLLWIAIVKHMDGSAPLHEARSFVFPVRSGTDPHPDGADRSEPSSNRVDTRPVSSWPAPAPSDERIASTLTAAQLQACLDRNNGVIASAARELGLSSRFALHRLIRKHGLEIRKRSAPR